jgi:hypothetical protein
VPQLLHIAGADTLPADKAVLPAVCRFAASPVAAGSRHRRIFLRKKNAPQQRGVFNQRQTGYLAAISATVVSSMRFEKPHSLSYHDDTFTRRPDTLVRVESKLLDAGLWLKSTDTSGSVW